MEFKKANTANILLVDDEPEVLGMIKLKYKHEIETGAYRFLYADGGNSALNLLESENDIDMIITDINLPGMNGLELLEKVKNYNKPIKAVVVSAYGDMENIRLAMNNGAYDFLIKPINFDDLTATIEKTRKEVDDLKKNISTLKETEKDLQKSRALYSAIVNSSLEAIAVFDKYGIIHDLNRAAEKLFGYSKNDISGKNIGLILTDLFPEGTDRKSDQPIIDNFIKSKLIGKIYETILKRRDRTLIQVELVSAALELNGDEFFTVMLRDITMRKRAEVLLREYNLTLEIEVSNRTEELVKLNNEKNEILAIAAHDLKNPISNILMLAKNLNTGELNNRETIEYSEDIITSSQRMLELIKNLLDVNKIEQGKFKPEPEEFQIDFLIKSVLNSFKDYAGSKKIKLKFDKKSVIPDIYADRNATLQILDNLISNAIKFTPIGGEVKIAIESAHQKVKVKVIDNGPGISYEEQNKLFKKFSRLSTRPTAGENSTGLGLSIVKKLASLINSDVYYDPASKEGSTFVIELPVSDYLS